MTAKTINPLEIWSTPAADAFKFWTSLWPTAPLFGVEWRYADAFAQWSPLMGKHADTNSAAPKAAKPKAAKPKMVKTQTVAAEAAPAAKITPAAEITPVVASIAAPAETTGSTEPGVPTSLMVKAPADADDLTVIKGVGPALARQLNGLGVYKISQIAGFSDEDFAWVDLNLSAPRGRCFRDDWAGQAKALLS
jgi:predicted flap endonuclease-1-like 5' DNA nuclease